MRFLLQSRTLSSTLELHFDFNHNTNPCQFQEVLVVETSQVLPDLAQCLLALPWHTLRALAKANGCSFNGRWTQAQAANALADALRHPERLVALLPTLSPGAQAALRHLCSAGGSLVYADFTFRYGVLTPYRPWRATNPVKPWETPASPTEELFYSGLVFPFTLGTSRHPLRVLAVPTDFHPTLAVLFAPLPVETQSGVATPTTAGNVWTENLLAFLSFLQRESPRPLHGRWLPPSMLRTLAALFHPPYAPATPPHSELAWPYLAFLHFLAERAGLVALSAGHLQPTTAAWEWLAAPEATRWQQLWDAWSASDSENTALWHRYRLPLWHEETPQQRFREFCAAMRERPPQQEAPDSYLDALEIHAPELFRPAIAFRQQKATQQGKAPAVDTYQYPP